jgi:hypothetical protein
MTMAQRRLEVVEQPPAKLLDFDLEEWAGPDDGDWQPAFRRWKDARWEWVKQHGPDSVLGDLMVLGTHREVQLYGGKELEGDDIQQAVLTRASAEADRQLDIIPVDPSNLPAGGAFRIDTRTRRPIPLDRPET